MTKKIIHLPDTITVSINLGKNHKSGDKLHYFERNIPIKHAGAIIRFIGEILNK